MAETQNPKPAGPEAMAEAALSAAQAAVTNLKQTTGVAGETPRAFEPQPLDKGPTADGVKGIDLLSDVNLNVKIELGRTRMLVEDVLKLNEGAVVELDKLAGDPVDVYVNDRHIARGEVLVLNDNFCVRINEIIHQIGDTEQPGRAAG
jgi:flagellar motor switch protein FliN/FliY